LEALVDSEVAGAWNGAAAGAGAAGARAPALAELILRSHEQMQRLAAEDARQIARLRDHAGGAVSLFLQVPLFDEDIFDVGGLLRLGEHLVG
jgi:hypothetical protein